MAQASKDDILISIDRLYELVEKPDPDNSDEYNRQMIRRRIESIFEALGDRSARRAMKTVCESGY